MKERNLRKLDIEEQGEKNIHSEHHLKELTHQNNFPNIARPNIASPKNILNESDSAVVSSMPARIVEPLTKAQLQNAVSVARKKLRDHEVVNFGEELEESVKISIIIPVYNAQDYLPEVLQSLVNQTLQDLEIICVDDCSQDASEAIIRSFAAQYPHVKGIFFRENKTASLARKAGVLMSSGTYILFVDADDELNESACEILFDIMQEGKTDILQFNSRIVNCSKMPQNRIANMEKLVSPYPGELRDVDLIRACFDQQIFRFALWGKLFNAQICKEAFLQVEDIALPKAQDLYASFLIYFYARSYKGLPELFLYSYNFGRGNTGHEIMHPERFTLYCSMVWVYNAVERFLIKQNARESYADVVEKIRSSLLSDCMANWLRLKRKDKPKGFELMMDSWGVVPTVSHLAAQKWYQRVSVTNELFTQDFLPCTKQKIRTIGIFYYWIANGGAQRVLVKLIEHWVEMGYNVVLFTDRGETDNDYPLPLGVKHVQWPDSSNHIAAKYAERCHTIYQSMQVYEVDVIVYHAWSSTSTIWDMLTIKSLGIPFVMHTHSLFSAMIASQTSYFGDMPYVYRFFDYVVTLTRVDEMYWRNFCKSVIYTSNPFTFSLDEITTNDLSGMNILWVGRLSKEKNPYDAIKIIKRITESVPDAILHVVGDNPTSDYLEDMKKMVNTYGLEGNIIFHGFHKDVEAFYQQASVFLMTSQYEGFSLTLVESRSFGIPCVTYDMPYLEMHRDGRGLIRVPQGDIEAAADAVVSLLLDEQQRKVLGKEARAAAEDMWNFDVKAVWRKIFSDLESGEKADQTPYLPDPEIMKILLDTLATHSEMGSRIQKGRQYELSNAKMRIDNLEKSRDDVLEELTTVQKEATVTQKELEVTQKELEMKQKEIKMAQKQITIAQKEITTAQKEIALIRTSWSYRIGGVFTWLPHKVKDWLSKK